MGVKLEYLNYYLQKRGPDLTKVVDYDLYTFVHNLLHITGKFTPQPFVDQANSIVCLYNGEVYNYNEFGKQYDSDGECLIPLYLEKGIEFINELDGEFAIVLYDFKKRIIVLSTDIFRTKPIWYHVTPEKEIIISSYQSAIQRFGFGGATLIEPNTTLVLNLDTKKIIKEHPVYKFDLRQHKTHFNDWITAFNNAIIKRTRNLNHPIFICLSSGYDSGCIAAALNYLNINYSSYTFPYRENKKIVSDRIKRDQQKNNLNTCINLGKEEFQKLQTEFIHKNCEPCQVPTLFDGKNYNVCNDWAAVGLTKIFKLSLQQKIPGKIYLSGHGGDEIYSDYGYQGKALKICSEICGVFPADLKKIFPWRNFFHGQMECFIAKEEHVAGSLGIEGRYPFLDKDVVQEFLWIDHKLKNKFYKAPLHHYLMNNRYPFELNIKRGFKVVPRKFRKK